MGRAEVALTEGLFVFGTLRDPALLRVVAGGEVASQSAQLRGFAIATAEGEDFPILVPGETAEGLLLTGLSVQQMARLDYYEAPYGYSRKPITVETQGGPVKAEVYCPPEELWSAGAPWSLNGWQAIWGPVMREAAREVMAGQWEVTPQQVAERFPVIRARAQQRVNARTHTSPSELRVAHSRQDVVLQAKTRKYSNFFALDEFTVDVAKFDGQSVQRMERAVFVSADAVTVLPYDPVRDRVMLIEQFRAAAYLRGDLNPWSLEVIAGRQDGGETHMAAAHREAFEETGLRLSELHRVAAYYGSPGTNTEYLTSYIGIADLPDEAAGIGGLAHEAEDIRSMVVSFDRLMQAVDRGEAENAPLILSALHLARLRPSLR